MGALETISLLFKKYSLTIAIIGFAVVLVLVFILYLISIVSGKEMNLGFGKFSLKLGKKNSSKVQRIKTLLNDLGETETYKNLIGPIVDKTKEKTEEKDVIKLKETVTRQMAAAEDANIRIKALMSNKYAELLEENLNGENVRTHKYYKYYQIILASILDDTKRKILKQSLENNDIIKFSDLELEKFIEQKSEIMITVIFDYLDLLHSENSSIDMDELRKENKVLVPQLKNIIKDLYFNIKGIIQHDLEIIKNIDYDLGKTITELTETHNKNNPIQKIKKIIDKDKNE